VTKPDTHTVFFRLLKTSIDDKGARLAAQIAALNETGEAEETYTLDPADFALIPGSPFAFWASRAMFDVFREYPLFEAGERTAKRGPSTGDDFRRVRLWWEVSPKAVGRLARWVPFSKGGTFSPFFFDIHLLVDWDEERYTFRDFYGRPGREIPKLEACSYFFRPGLTWPRRTTSGISVRPLPVGCIFADKGPSAFVPDDDPEEMLALLAVMNSTPFESLIKLQLGAATAAARSYEVGVIQRTPLPPLTQHESRTTLAALAREAHDLQRSRDRSDETTHAFCLLGLVQHRAAGSLLDASLALEAEAQAAQARLAAIQADINDLVFDLYGLNEVDRALVRAEMGKPETSNLELETAEEDDEDEITPPEDLPARVQNLLMWCVGVTFGRWDVRFALDPTLLPALQGPFDPLPRCAPGALVGPDGLPPARAADIVPESWLRARENVLHVPPPPLEGDGASTKTGQPETLNLEPETTFAWDGILVDDPTHPSDVVTRVRGVLALLWQDRAGDIEREACQILGFDALRDYFRDPRKGFFAFHIKRYSKSRRKAPIYWLLQSEKRNYGIWLYIHRLRPDALFVAGRDYADAKVALEEARLEELRQGLALSLVEGLDALSGSARRHREREIERQQKLVAEVTEFRDRLDRIALLNLPPDLNDGVVISIAPLWEMVPWKEAQRMWEKLVAGEYEWSTMAQRMRERGLVKNTSC
jgi:hypothetical protein